MKINKLKINSFGKLKGTEINLKEGINIISGNNESGKSTLLKFIVGSFYGLSKNKKGKEISDLERYTPWIGEEFTGKLEYELDNKEKFEVYREFKKKNPKIFNENKEDISKQFNIDKTNGNEFFYEQTKVDEELFTSTVVVGQQEVKLGKQEQSMLIQKIANLVGTGEDNVSYKRAIDRINRRQLDEIGSNKSREKPINIVSRKIEALEKEKIELEKYKEFRYNIEENKSNLKKEITKLENENELLKKLKIIKEEEKLENEKIKTKENIKNENEKKIEKIKNRISEIETENENIKEEKIKNKISKNAIAIFIILMIINIIQFILVKNQTIRYAFLLTIPAYLIFLLFLKSKQNKEQKNKEKIINEKREKVKNEIINLNNEMNLIKNNNENLENEINNLINSLKLKINFEKEKIEDNYKNKIEKNKIDSYLKLENTTYEIENLQTKINNKKIELHSLELDKQNIEPQLETLAQKEEELVNDKERMSTLQKTNLSFEFAKEALSEAYEEMKNTVTPKFTQALSKNISKITNGKYNKIQYNDEQGLIVELEDGNYVTGSKLSIGTIDQLYLSLRLSMLEELSEEKMPIILDEAFAYYDTERLANILKYISEEFKNHQVIIFTCTNREKELLDKLQIQYNINMLNRD